MPLTDRIKNIATRFVINLVTENDVRKFVRAYLVKRLQLVDAAAFTKAIYDDTDLWGGLPQAYHNMAEKLAQNPAARAAFQKYSKMINVDLVLMWLGGYQAAITLSDGRKGSMYVKGDRPDLAGVVYNWPDETARKWLSKQIETVKEQFVQIQAAPPPKIVPRVTLRQVGGDPGTVLSPGAGQDDVLRPGLPGEQAGPGSPPE